MSEDYAAPASDAFTAAPTISTVNSKLGVKFGMNSITRFDCNDPPIRLKRSTMHFAMAPFSYDDEAQENESSDIIKDDEAKENVFIMESHNMILVNLMKLLILGTVACLKARMELNEKESKVTESQ